MNRFMQLAIQEARAARDAGDFPYGSVLVRGETVIGTGRNHVNTRNDPTSHAEMEVLRSAGLQATYKDTILYASAFPCIMCAGPMVFYGIPELVAGASWPGYDVSRNFLVSHHVKITILELDECRELLK